MLGGYERVRMGGRVRSWAWLLGWVCSCLRVGGVWYSAYQVLPQEGEWRRRVVHIGWTDW